MLEGYTEISREQIHRSDLNTADVMKPLITFDSIIDTDVGLIILIAKKYRNPNIFNLELLDSMTVKDLAGVLYARPIENPISICTNVALPEIDELYQDFMDNYYQDVLEYSITTELINTIEIWEKYGGIHTTILCKTQSEIDLLDQYYELKKCDKILLENAKKANILNTFPQYYFKHTEDDYIREVSNTPLVAKTIYIPRYQFNFDIDDKGKRSVNKSPSIMRIYEGIANIFMAYDIYKRTDLYGKEETEDNQ